MLLASVKVLPKNICKCEPPTSPGNTIGSSKPKCDAWQTTRTEPSWPASGSMFGSFVMLAARFTPANGVVNCVELSRPNSGSVNVVGVALKFDSVSTRSLKSSTASSPRLIVSSDDKEVKRDTSKTTARKPATPMAALKLLVLGSSKLPNLVSLSTLSS